MLLIVVLLILILIYLIKDYHNCQKKDNEPHKINNKERKKKIYYKSFYQPKKYILSLNELNFYTTLMEIAKELDLIVFSQVSLYNIVEVLPNLNYTDKTTYLNKITKKSIDFVMVEKNNCRIKLCIELDDSTHKQESRIKRDMFINELFKTLEINLLRYPTYKMYYKDTLKKRIQENMKEHNYTN